MDFIFFVGCEKESVEGVMDSPHFREAQLVGDQRQDFDNHEGSFTFGGKFRIGNHLFEISGF